MAKIRNLVLTVSRNSKNEVTVQVNYVIHFTDTERAMNVAFIEVVELYEREGIRDDDAPLIVANPAGDLPDQHVVLIGVGGVLPGGPGSGSINSNPKHAKTLSRSWKKTLTPNELMKLRDVGREHPYVKVRLVPNNISADSKIAELVIDIGDPGE